VNIPSLGGKEIVVGPIRHRSCEPLVVPSEKGGRTVQEGIAMAMMGVEGIYRQQVLDGVVFCGEMAEIHCEWEDLYWIRMGRLEVLTFFFFFVLIIRSAVIGYSLVFNSLYSFR
jgi:hypothetical protein